MSEVFQERTGLLDFFGKDVTVVGPDLEVGDWAPEFTAWTSDWAEYPALERTRNKVRIIGSLLSVNTGVCNQETRRFNQEAAALGPTVATLMVSMDLPWTLGQWCAAAGVDQVVTLSDHRAAEFGARYGVLLKEPRIFRRAIWVVGRDGKITYAAYMPALGVEPDYAQVLQAARMALS